MGPTLCIIFCFLQPPPAPPPVTVTACPRVVAHDADWQRRAAQGLRAASPEVRAMAQEWISLRDQSRACSTAGKGK